METAAAAWALREARALRHCRSSGKRRMQVQGSTAQGGGTPSRPSHGRLATASTAVLLITMMVRLHGHRLHRALQTARR